MNYNRFPLSKANFRNNYKKFILKQWSPSKPPLGVEFPIQEILMLRHRCTWSGVLSFLDCTFFNRSFTLKMLIMGNNSSEVQVLRNGLGTPNHVLKTKTLANATNSCTLPPWASISPKASLWVPTWLVENTQFHLATPTIFGWDLSSM